LMAKLDLREAPLPSSSDSSPGGIAAKSQLAPP
jgi:hypothetical protein